MRIMTPKQESKLRDLSDKQIKRWFLKIRHKPYYEDRAINLFKEMNKED